MNFSDFHIAHLSSSHYPDDLRIFAKELNSLAQAGFRTTFVVQAPEKFRQPIHRANKKENIVIFNLKTGADRFSRLLRIAEIWKSLKEIKPDLVHLHDPELLLIVPLIKLQCHIPIIFDDHENISKDILTNYSIPKFLRATIAKIVFRFQLFVFHWLDGLVLVSEAFRNDYGNFPAKSMAIVRNFPISKNNDSQSPKPVPGRLIFIGRSTPVRGIEEMINALKFVNCQQASLVIIGPVDASYHEHLNKIIYSN
jgi:glycosyltransferase involved in cell wall biosynthesis